MKKQISILEEESIEIIFLYDFRSRFSSRLQKIS